MVVWELFFHFVLLLDAIFCNGHPSYNAKYGYGSDGNDLLESYDNSVIDELPEDNRRRLHFVDIHDASEPTTLPPFQWSSDKDLEIESVDSINGIAGKPREIRDDSLSFEGGAVDDSEEQLHLRFGRDTGNEGGEEGFVPDEESASWLLSQDIWEKVSSGEDDDAISDSELMEKLLQIGKRNEESRAKRDTKVDGDLELPEVKGLENVGEEKKSVDQGIHSWIDVSLLPPVVSHATIKVLSDTPLKLAAEHPPVAKVPGPIFFCGTKTNPNASDPDSPDSQVFESSRTD